MMTGNGTASPRVWGISRDLWRQIQPLLMKQGTLQPATLDRKPQDGVLVVEDPFYIVAASPPADEQSRVLKHGDTFAVFDHYGDVRSAGLQEEGIYHEGTRFISGWVMRLGPDRPLILSSNVKRDNALLTVDLTNLDIPTETGVIPRGT